MLLVRSKLTLKLHKLFQVRNRPKPKLDIHKLKWKDIRRRCNVKVRNMFEALDIEGDVNEHAQSVEKEYNDVEAAEEVL